MVKLTLGEVWWVGGGLVVCGHNKNNETEAHQFREGNFYILKITFVSHIQRTGPVTWPGLVWPAIFEDNS